MKWALALSIIASAIALSWPEQELVVAAARPGDRVTTRATVSNVYAPVSPEREQTLSGEARVSNGLVVASGDVSADVFDPFVGVVAPPPPAPIVVAPAPVAASPPPPSPMNYHFIGRMTGPDGVQQIFLSQGDKIVAVAKGTTLDNGYVVEDISDDAVEVVAPSSGFRVSIPAVRGER